MSEHDHAASGAGSAALAHLRAMMAPAAGASEATQEFAVVPLSRSNAFLVPLSSRAVSRRSLAEYSALRTFPKRVVREVLGAAWTLGLPELVLRRRAVLPTGDETLLGHLRTVLDEPAMTFATGLRWVGSFYTPVLQLFRPDGTPVAYAKIGWDDVTNAQVRAEAEALRLVEAAAPRRFHAPAPLHAGPWGRLELSVTAPLPRRSKRVPRELLPPVLALYDVAQLDGPMTRSTVRASTWWQRTVADAPELEGQAPGLTDALDRLDAEVGEAELEFGRWHGDWVAWNMALAPDGVHVWDWEYSRPDVPFGLDLLQYYLQEYFVAGGQPLLRAFDRVAADATGGLRRLGVDDDAQRVLQRLHRLEHRLRAERAVRAGVDADPGVRDAPISTLL